MVEKYCGIYEMSIMHLQQSASSRDVLAHLEKLFTLIVRVHPRHRDTHIENFGAVLAEDRLAPVYNPAMTALYPAKVGLAPTLHATTEWPDSKADRRLAETRMTGTPTHDP